MTDFAEIKKEKEELEQKLSDPQFVRDIQKYKDTAARTAKLEKIILARESLEKTEKEIEELRVLERGKDQELADMAAGEIPRLEKEKRELEKTFKKLTNAGSDESIVKIIMEIRAGAGGDEASLFAQELFQMYIKYAESQKWHVELIDESRNTLGGLKEAVFEIDNEDAYQNLKYESGVHRVQRVPATEKIGRIHTSTVSVAVLPVAKDVEIEIRPEDIDIDFFRSSGPGGQNVNKVETAVRLTHIPTGVVVTSQHGRSQAKNREHAMTLLKTRLLDSRKQKEAASRAEERKEQIGTGDRSEKIRTYNFPQDRITDHRIK
ncbi:peptide chain release factor 1, partial [Patescibacteria group bacterium]|nr:peptide chain release factor 1 [Patescibacteria group bacterium]